MSDTRPPEPEILTGFWKDLEPHSERNAIFIVNEELDLLDVARKIAADDAEVVAAWIEDQEIRRPTPLELKSWNQEPTKSFRFSIVQPYVLIQDRPQ